MSAGFLTLPGLAWYIKLQFNCLLTLAFSTTCCRTFTFLTIDARSFSRIRLFFIFFAFNTFFRFCGPSISILFAGRTFNTSSDFFDTDSSGVPTLRTRTACTSSFAFGLILVCTAVQSFVTIYTYGLFLLILVLAFATCITFLQ